MVLKNITKSYDGKTVLNNVSISFPKGSKTAISGPSGCGKTTLFRIMCSLEKQDSGETELDENTLFSVVFQENRLCDNLSGLANVKLVSSKDVTRDEILFGFHALGLSGFENKRTKSYSGGMKRRCAILRALFADYDILLLDEPFNGLDTDAKRVCADYILNKCGSRTLVMISHNKEDAELLRCQEISLDNINNS